LLRLTSTLPAPNPKGIAIKNINKIDGANENPKRAAAVIATLAAVTVPVLNLARILLDEKLDMIVPPLIVMARYPAMATGASSPDLIAGQALPRSESGSPKLINAAYIRINNATILFLLLGDIS
jgi:hypothetical protein